MRLQIPDLRWFSESPSTRLPVESAGEPPRRTSRRYHERRTGSDVTQSTAVRSRWRRPLTWVLLVVGVLVAWLLVSLALTGWHAKQANTALANMKAQIAAGDTAAAQASIDSARSDTAAMQSAVASLPISALRVVPYVNTNLTGAQEFMNAAQEVLDAAEVTNQLYGQMAGTSGEGPAVFENGTISISALQEIQPQINEVAAILDQADQSLQQVPADVSPMLRGYVDEAADQVAGIQKGLRIYDMMLPDLPQLLGETSLPGTWSCSTIPASSTPAVVRP